MQSDTFKSKLSKLIHKSRKAIRLYSTVSRPQNKSDKPYSEIQMAEWRIVNEELLNDLLQIIKNTHIRKVTSDLNRIRHTYVEKMRSTENQIHTLHKDLVKLSIDGDFVNAAKNSTNLIPLKARHQAFKAVLDEIDDILESSNIKKPIIALTEDDKKGDESLKVSEAKVIPFKRSEAG